MTTIEPPQNDLNPATLSEEARANPSRLFIKRPIATALLMISILLGGLVSFNKLSLSALPEVDYPTIQVTTLYPGAAPDVMNLTVTAPLERQMGQMVGLSRMSSVSSAGSSVITLQFGLEVPLDVAEQEVQASINNAGTLLPSDLPTPPVYAKVNPADAPIVSLAVSSQSRPLQQVQDLVDKGLAGKLSQISGVGLVSLSNGQRPAIRIKANVQALAEKGLSLESLRTAIAANNANGAKGSFDGPLRSWSINANDQLSSVEDYKNLVIASPNGAPVHLSDVAEVREDKENIRVGAWVGTSKGGAVTHQPAIVVDIRKQPGANVINTANKIKAALPQLSLGIPADVKVTILADRTQSIQASVHDVEFELVLAVLLVVLVIFLFLGSLKATLIASLSVPLSLIGSFAIMQPMGFSLNNLTLMALTIASGFVVDDAIVVLENINRHVEEGMSNFEAALRGSREIGFTIISLTISLIAVLIPLLFMGDVVGRLFREFAVTLAIAIFISAIVSLTLVPMMSARGGQKHEVSAPRNALIWRVADTAQSWFERLAALYTIYLDKALARQKLVMQLFLASLVITAALFVIIPKGLFPVQDTNQLQATLVVDTETSYAHIAELEHRVAETILKNPGVESLSASIGVDGQNAALNTARMTINLKDKSARASQSEIMEKLRVEASKIAGMQLFIKPTQDLTIDSEVSPAQYHFALQGVDDAVIGEWTQKLVTALNAQPALAHISSDALSKGNGIKVGLNRDTAARLGITAAAVDAALYDAFGQRIISTIFTTSTQYRVILESPDAMQTAPESLARLYVPSNTGVAVPLSEIATIVPVASPLQMQSVSQFPAATIGFDLGSSASLGEAVDAIRATQAAINMPASITTKFIGASEAYKNALSNEFWLILAAIVCVYIVLGVLYESYIHPLTILSTLPSAGIGALLALVLTGHDLGVIGIIGIVLLIGIVKKNAIMMIDFALVAEREEGLSPFEAIRKAALLRFRPIMMTSFAALFAALPLVFGMGMGSELRLPLGLSIAGGLIFSQVMTLFTTPVIYLAFDAWVKKLKDTP
jgi:multidrug efflux pump